MRSSPAGPDLAVLPDAGFPSGFPSSATEARAELEEDERDEVLLEDMAAP